MGHLYRYALLFLCSIYGTILNKDAFCQKISPIYERQFLHLDTQTDRYLITKGDTSVFLKIPIEGEVKFDTISMILSNSGDSSYTVKGKRVSEKKPFQASEFHLSSENKLYGVFIQKKNEIRFYPEVFREKWKDPKQKELAENRNKLLDKSEFYVLDIPRHAVVKAHYSAFHFGALTIPAKIFVRSIDTTTSAQFGVNINLMIGGQWGKKKYFYIAEEKMGDYLLAKSMNLVLGISPLNLGPETTNGELASEITVPAGSFGFSFGWHYKSIGLFAVQGFDVPLSKFGKHWIYNRVPWFGFGIGLGL